jgi:hypothetical protein
MLNHSFRKNLVAILPLSPIHGKWVPSTIWDSLSIDWHQYRFDHQCKVFDLLESQELSPPWRNYHHNRDLLSKAISATIGHNLDSSSSAAKLAYFLMLLYALRNGVRVDIITNHPETLFPDKNREGVSKLTQRAKTKHLLSPTVRTKHREGSSPLVGSLQACIRPWWWSHMRG